MSSTSQRLSALSPHRLQHTPTQARKINSSINTKHREEITRSFAPRFRNLAPAKYLERRAITVM